MAYTATDLVNVEEAIRAIIAGTRTVSVSVSDKTFTFAAADLKSLQALRAEISAELALAAGSFSPRSYAKQGGRGI